MSTQMKWFVCHILNNCLFVSVWGRDPDVSRLRGRGGQGWWGTKCWINGCYLLCGLLISFVSVVADCFTSLRCDCVSVSICAASASTPHHLFFIHNSSFLWSLICCYDNCAFNLTTDSNTKWCNDDRHHHIKLLSCVFTLFTFSLITFCSSPGDIFKTNYFMIFVHYLKLAQWVISCTFILLNLCIHQLICQNIWSVSATNNKWLFFCSVYTLRYNMRHVY